MYMQSQLWKKKEKINKKINKKKPIYRAIGILICNCLWNGINSSWKKNSNWTLLVIWRWKKSELVQPAVMKQLLSTWPQVSVQAEGLSQEAEQLLADVGFHFSTPQPLEHGSFTRVLLSQHRDDGSTQAVNIRCSSWAIVHRDFRWHISHRPASDPLGIELIVLDAEPEISDESLSALHQDVVWLHIQPENLLRFQVSQAFDQCSH